MELADWNILLKPILLYISTPIGQFERVYKEIINERTKQGKRIKSGTTSKRHT